jgi:hypothetical protein
MLYAHWLQIHPLLNAHQFKVCLAIFKTSLSSCSRLKRSSFLMESTFIVAEHFNSNAAKDTLMRAKPRFSIWFFVKNHILTEKYIVVFEMYRAGSGPPGSLHASPLAQRSSQRYSNRIEFELE